MLDVPAKLEKAGVYENWIEDYCCGRPEEPAILISTLLLQTHARQLCSLALTRFLLNSWVFHLECMKCMECNWGFPVHVAFDAILRPHSASSELRSVLLDFKRWARASSGLFFSLPQAWSKSDVCPWPEKRVDRDCCSSDLFVLDHVEAWRESVGPPWSGFLHL